MFQSTPIPQTFIPSPYQQAFFDALADTSLGNLFVEAVAGSGKTTTIVEGCNRLPTTATRILLAFNKSIAEELKARGVPGSTFHAMGLNALRPHLPQGFKIEGNKCATIFRAIVAKDLQEDFADLPRLVSLGKNYGIGVFEDLANEADSWQAVIDEYDLGFDGPNIAKACDFAKRILTISNNDFATIDFDDMLYMPLLINVPFKTYNYVFVDEAQDLNGIQLEILRRMARHGVSPARFIFVGDRHQAIYGFRGAGTDGVQRIISRFSCCTLPLSVSYRCPRAVVAYAQRYVPHIESAEGAPVGSVTPAKPWSPDAFPAGSAILCRNTKPLIRAAYAFLRSGRRVQVLGRDIGAGFKALIKKARARDREDLVAKLATMRDAEVSKARTLNQHRKAEAIEDKYESLFVIMDAVPDATPDDLPKAIDELFAQQPGAVQFATVHKAKGLEWPTVAILDFDRLMPSKFAVDGWQLQQEYNLIYVAITRAKRDLLFINSNEMEGE